MEMRTPAETHLIALEVAYTFVCGQRDLAVLKARHEAGLGWGKDYEGKKLHQREVHREERAKWNATVDFFRSALKEARTERG